MARRFISATAVVVLTLGAVVVTATGAEAAKGPKGKTACTTITGTVSGNIQISGCVDSNGANTGGASVPFPTLNLATGGTITWASGKTTTLGLPITVPTNAKKCPGYVKGATTNPTALKVGGAVTADTSGMKVPGKVKGAICLAADLQTVTLLKTFKIS
jgi:hypothetical protein